MRPDVAMPTMAAQRGHVPHLAMASTVNVATRRPPALVAKMATPVAITPPASLPHLAGRRWPFSRDHRGMIMNDRTRGPR